MLLTLAAMAVLALMVATVALATVPALALALARYGFRVPEIYGTLSGENFIYVKQLAVLSPETKVFSNLEPTMLYYDGSQSGVNLTIGKDAGYYHKGCPNVRWNEERQPFGYAGVRRLFEALAEV